MRFWDSSALLAVILAEPQAPLLATLFREEDRGLMWMLSPVEVRSGLCRAHRERKLDAEGKARVWEHFIRLRGSLAEVGQVAQVRDIAEQLLEVHPLQAGDALQLAAAFLAERDREERLGFVTLDRRLAEAASQEGFEVLPPLTGETRVGEERPILHRATARGGAARPRRPRARAARAPL